MEINELRIGNWLQYLSGDIFQVEELHFYTFKSTPKYLYPRPIPLTKEWLLRVGFEKTYADNTFRKMFSKMSLHSVLITFTNSDNILTVSDNYTGKELLIVFINPVINYVHQVQNLYFSLTGEELKIITE